MLRTLRGLLRYKFYLFYANIRPRYGPVTNSAPYRVVGFNKLFFVILPDMSYKNLYKRIQECWLYVIWLFLLADLFSVSRTNTLIRPIYVYYKHGGGPIAIHVCRWSCTLQKRVMDYCDLSIKQLGQQHWNFNCIPVTAVN